MKKSLTVILLFVWGCMQAQEFLCNGLWYEIISEDERTVSVVEPSWGDYRCGGFLFDSWAPYSGDVVIPSTIEHNNITYTVNAIANRTFSGFELTSVSIPESIVTIGENAFDDTRLKSLTVPESVTSIGTNAFRGVKNIHYSGSAEGSPWGAVTVNGIIDGDFVYSDEQKSVLSAYVGQSSEVTVPIGVTTIGKQAFAYSNITSVVIPDGVVSIGNEAFGFCEKLVSVSIPESVTSIGELAFCSSLDYDIVSITIPESVSSIGRLAFSDVKNIYYSGLAEGSPWGAQTVNGVVDGDYVYSDAEKKEISYYIGHSSDVVIPDGVVSIGVYAFAYKGDKIASVTIPEGVVSIGDDAFWGSKLQSVKIPQSVVSIGSSAFSGCDMKIIEVPETVTTIGDCAFLGIKNVVYSGSAEGSPWCAAVVNGIADGDFFYFDTEKTKIASYIGTGMVANVPEGVVSIPVGTFKNCKNLTLVTIPGSVSTISEEMFEDCSNLTSVTLSEGVKYIKNHAFSGCEKLPTLTIPESVTDIEDYCFVKCSSLTELVIKSKECPFFAFAHLIMGAVPDVYMYVPCEAMESYSRIYFNGYPELLNGTTEEKLTRMAENGYHLECIKTVVPYVAKEHVVAIVNNQIMVDGEAPAFVYTIMGQKIANKNLKSGVYFVTVEGETVKVVK